MPRSTPCLRPLFLYLKKKFKIPYYSIAYRCAGQSRYLNFFRMKQDFQRHGFRLFLLAADI